MSDKNDKKKKNKDGQDSEKKTNVKNSIVMNPPLKEQKSKTVVFGWGRINPPTTGHEKLAKKLKLVARKENATPLLYLTHSQDAKKNPLSYEDKIDLARKAFGNIVQKSKSKTIIQAMKELDRSYDRVILIVGQDRVKEFDTLLNKYNGKEYNFENIDVISAGDRDPDADDVTGMSASKMRALAASGKPDEFKKGLPSKLKQDADAIYDMVRAGMDLAEEMENLEESWSKSKYYLQPSGKWKKGADGRSEGKTRKQLEDEGLTDMIDESLTLPQRRQRAITMRKYKSKIAAARKRMSRRPADKKRITNRAKKKARNIIRAKVAGKKGKDYKSLSASEKSMIDKKVAKRQAAIERIAKRLVPKMKRADLKRVAGKGGPEVKIESKRWHEARHKDGTMKFDKRFKIFRDAPTPVSEASAAVERLKNQHEKEKRELRRDQETEMDRLKTRKMRRKITAINNNEQLILDDNGLLECIVAISENPGLVEMKKNRTDINESFGARFGTNRLTAAEREAFRKKDINRQKNSAKNAALAAIHRMVKSKGSKQSVSGYAFDIAKSYNIGMSGRELVKAYEKEYGKAEETINEGSVLRLKNQDGTVFNIWDNNKGLGYDIINRSGVNVSASSINPYARGHDNAKKAMVDVLYAYEKSGDVGAKKTLEKITRQKWVTEAYDKDGYTPAGPAGAGLENTDRLQKRYKKDTPGEVVDSAFRKDVNESFEMIVERNECQLVGMKQIREFEKVVDKLFEKFGLDFNFTRHFAERLGDKRNNPCITLKELAHFIKKIYKKQGKSLKGVAGAEAVVRDLQKDLNIPVAVTYDQRNDEFDVVMKTIMRKKNFRSPDRFINY